VDTPTYFDPIGETLDRAALAAHQLTRVQALLSEILPSNQFYRRKFGGLIQVPSWEAFQALSFTAKGELVADQAQTPPFGTNLTYSMERYVKLHQTSATSGKAPLRWLDTDASWSWWARLWGHVYRGAGVGPGDRVFLAFGFGPFIGFWSAYEGARTVGALTIPGGGMQSDQRLRSLLDEDATVLVCTPTYALRLAEVAAEQGLDLQSSRIRATIHAGEPGASVPQVRRRIEQAWGARCFDHAGLTEVGAIGFTCQEQAGMHLIETEFIVEVVDPQTGDQLQPGMQGELVVTNLGRPGMPVIRYRTGDLVQLTEEPCGCGRTSARLVGGILGRVDDMLVVRGVNVFPSAIEGVIREFPEIAEFRIELRRSRDMAEIRVVIEPRPENGSDDESQALVRRLAVTFLRRLLLRVQCVAVPPGALPRFELKARRVVTV
jgi:phenylacetate-CoA ligase